VRAPVGGRIRDGDAQRGGDDPGIEPRDMARDDRFGLATARFHQGARRIDRIARLGAAAALPGGADRGGHEQGIAIAEILDRPQAHRADFQGGLAELSMARGRRKAAAARGQNQSAEHCCLERGAIQGFQSERPMPWRSAAASAAS
jgi:hypothetical protein